VIIQGTSFSAVPVVTLQNYNYISVANCPISGHTYIVCETIETQVNVTVVAGNQSSNQVYCSSSEPVVVGNSVVFGGSARTFGGSILQVVAQGLGDDSSVVNTTIGGKACSVCLLHCLLCDAIISVAIDNFVRKLGSRVNNMG
jgi:hypothetical protein